MRQLSAMSHVALIINLHDVLHTCPMVACPTLADHDHEEAADIAAGGPIR
jgi:hypothetical protein